MDQSFNSPSMTKNLVSEDEAEIVVPKKKFKSSVSSNNVEPGAILRRGIKFENETEFDGYMSNVNSPLKNKKKKKMSHLFTCDTCDCIFPLEKDLESHKSTTHDTVSPKKFTFRCAPIRTHI